MENTLNIKAWAEEDRPREKLATKGKEVLSDAELIGILIGSGTRKLTAVDLSKMILKSVDNDLSKLAKLTIKNLCQFNGIGESKAISIIAALELGRRRNDTQTTEKPTINSSKASYDILKPIFFDLPHEEFWIILLTRANKVIQSFRVGVGGLSGTVADPKIIFKLALENRASAIVLAHNHPSGNLQPSQEDIRMTQKVQDAGKLLDIAVLDHIIFTDNGYYSFADESKL